ncbi:hypothetical protein [Ancylobacter aquaticus]|nr:hypothetical protein [Ancylobacter aquaticus]
MDFNLMPIQKESGAAKAGKRIKANEPLPARLKGLSRTTRFLTDGDPSDYTWVGVEPFLTQEQKSRAEAIIALSPILLAIIDGNPSNVDRRVRLDRGLNALIGVPLSRGRKYKDQLSHIERELARTYFLNIFGFNGTKLAYGTLCRQALQQANALQDLAEDQVADRIKTLRRRFERNMERLLIEAALSFEAEHIVRQNGKAKILNVLSELGVAVA